MNEYRIESCIPITYAILQTLLMMATPNSIHIFCCCCLAWSYLFDLSCCWILSDVKRLRVWHCHSATCVTFQNKMHTSFLNEGIFIFFTFCLPFSCGWDWPCNANYAYFMERSKKWHLSTIDASKIICFAKLASFLVLNMTFSVIFLFRLPKK